MKSSLSSPEEAERLTALDSYSILDSLPEQDYEDITKLAAQICGTPVALISLIDRERQWFKSNRGLSFRETPREDSFCAHNLTSPAKPLLVQDARLDERFRLNPLVTGDPNIVFYAGEPLVDEDGLALGSLCVIDSQVRQLGADQLEALRILAKQAVTLLTARRRAIQGAQLKQQLASSEARFRDIVQQSPAATLVLRGEDLVIDQINRPMLSFMGRGQEVIGQPLVVALPELANQDVLQQARRVYTEGVDFDGYEVLIPHARTGVRQNYYYDLSYRPLKEGGQLTGVIQVVTDVTAQVRARQQQEEQAAALRNAVELAELGTWTLDIASGNTYLSPRHADMFGLSTTVMAYKTALAIVHPDDRDRVRAAFEQALQPDSNGRYQAEYRIINATSGKQQLIRAKGETKRDAQGQPLRIAGVAQDVTLERESQLVLEDLVQQRTQELAATNEALVTTNEDFVDVNQALERANSDLIRSNQNLEQFAYIASHDLQEPLRKIQQFGDLLKTRFADSLDSQELVYLDRMQLAARRMSVLIKDLLAFSRISTTQAVDQPVMLNEVINGALESLSVAIEESGAQIEVDALPTVQGDSLQLSQLFQNLLTNALKFRRTSSTGTLLIPQITVRARRLTKGELPASAHPARDADYYYLIEVIDNGIGFEEKYLDRIFQVFQRLHGKNEFAGTGVGLAIVQKVATNHGGAITAVSKPNQGAMFCVYLPA